MCALVAFASLENQIERKKNTKNLILLKSKYTKFNFPVESTAFYIYLPFHHTRIPHSPLAWRKNELSKFKYN